MNPRDLLDKWASGEGDPPPVASLIGIKLLQHGEATGTVEVDAAERHHNAMGTVHGGILCDLADVAMGVAMATVLEDRETFTTLGLQISFFRRVRKGRVIATGRAVRRGRTTSYCECEILDDRGSLIAKANSTCLIVAAPRPGHRLMRFPGSLKRDPGIEAWMNGHTDELGAIAKRWFQVMRDCGDDVRELLHDGHPTACVADAAFAYVNAFKAHVNVGFFRGTELPDPEGLLKGTGKFMRHVKLRPDGEVDAAALSKLVHAAYTDMKGRLEGE